MCLCDNIYIYIEYTKKLVLVQEDTMYPEATPKHLLHVHSCEHIPDFRFSLLTSYINVLL